MRLPRIAGPLAAALVAAAVGLPSAAQAAPPKWVQRIDDVVGDEPVSVVIAYGGDVLYRHRSWVARPPASNEKLLLSMALLANVPADTRLPLRVRASAEPVDGVLHGDLWIIGHGDPETDRWDMRDLALALESAGIRRVHGHVVGATGPFARDWWARGWKDYFPTYYIALPTALTFEGNRSARGATISHPETRAAAALTSQLRRIGIRVTKKPGSGRPPARLWTLATLRSDPLSEIMRRMNVPSANFSAEVLGKLLGATAGSAPGTIDKGARAIERWAAARGVRVTAHDGSGLSYANRATTEGIVDLLEFAEGRPWGETLRLTLPTGGQGTLGGRLLDVRLRAKTGTLDGVSALSGWVWLNRLDDWAEFSILSRGISKSRSVGIENKIMRVVQANAAPR